MGQSSCSEPNWSSASQIPRILWNPKIHYVSHRSGPVVPALSQISPVLRAIPSYLCRINVNFNIIYAWIFQAVFFLQVSPPKKKLCIFLLPHDCVLPLAQQPAIGFRPEQQDPISYSQVSDLQYPF